MGTRERRDRERGELRSLIMNAARRLFAAEGYDSVSMRRIADAIEYSPAAIYAHFKDKESLIRELCNEDFGKLASQFMQLATEPDPLTRIRLAGHSYIQFAVGHPNHYKLMFMTEHSGLELTDDELKDRGNPEEDAYAFLLHAVSEAMAAGKLRLDLKDPQLVAQTFWAVVHGVASLQVAKANDPWVDWVDLQTRSQCAIDAVIRGLQADPLSAEQIAENRAVT